MYKRSGALDSISHVVDAGVERGEAIAQLRHGKGDVGGLKDRLGGFGRLGLGRRKALRREIRSPCWRRPSRYWQR
jgi:hypothetical protein